MKESGKSAEDRIVLENLPGGAEAFSLAVDFCYGLEAFKVTPSWLPCSGGLGLTARVPRR
jgi:hypothetical protein